MDSELKWQKARTGHITASELHKLKIGKRGGVTEEAKNYISKKRFERKYGYPLLEDNKYFRMGKMYEQDAIEWIRAQFPDLDIRYSQDESEFEYPPFYTVEWAKFGASPDAESRDGRLIIDTKVLCTPSTICFHSDPTIPHEIKRAKVLAEHGDQMAGLMLARPKCQEFWIVKYNPMLEDNMLDTEPTTAAFRGFVYKYTRQEFGMALDSMKEMIIFADKFIDSPYSPDDYGKAQLINNQIIIGG